MTRNQRIRELRLSGEMSLREIGALFGISGQRVYQIAPEGPPAPSLEEIERRREERFWDRVDKSGGPDACWPWTGSRVSGGYGHFSRGNDGVNTQEYAHREAYRLAHGVPGDGHVCHRCDNPPCCNPAHLFLGTPLSNHQDCKAKGRFGTRKTVDRTPVEGVIHGRPSTYTNHACRCEECKDAFVQWNKKYLIRLCAKPIREDQHGTRYGYNTKKCRCRKCTDAASEYWYLRYGRGQGRRGRSGLQLERA